MLECKMTETMEFNECLGSNREGEGMLVFRRHVHIFSRMILISVPFFSF